MLEEDIYMFLERSAKKDDVSVGHLIRKIIKRGLSRGIERQKAARG